MTDVHDHSLTSGSVFKLVWTGWFWGVGSCLLPIFVIVLLVVAATNPREAAEGILGLLLFPLVLGLQGAMIGGAVIVGLFVHRRLFAATSRSGHDAT